MKDLLGVKVEIGDIVVSASGGGSWAHKIGKVYSFSASGLAMIKYPENGKWRKSSTGWSVLVLRKEADLENHSMPVALYDRLYMDYEADAPSVE